MTISEFDMYMTTLDEVENRIIDDTKFPVVKDSKIKNLLLCYIRTTENKFRLSKSKYK